MIWGHQKKSLYQWISNILYYEDIFFIILFTLYNSYIVTKILFILVDTIRAHNPILKWQSVNSNVVLIIVLYKDDFMTILALLEAVKKLERGACIEWRMHIGAIILIYDIPLLVLKNIFKRIFGNIVNIIVHGIPINNDIVIACFI